MSKVKAAWILEQLGPDGIFGVDAPKNSGQSGSSWYWSLWDHPVMALLLKRNNPSFVVLEARQKTVEECVGLLWEALGQVSLFETAATDQPIFLEFPTKCTKKQFSHFLKVLQRFPVNRSAPIFIVCPWEHKAFIDDQTVAPYGQVWTAFPPQDHELVPCILAMLKGFGFPRGMKKQDLQDFAQQLAVRCGGDLQAAYDHAVQCEEMGMGDAEEGSGARFNAPQSAFSLLDTLVQGDRALFLLRMTHWVEKSSDPSSFFYTAVYFVKQVLQAHGSSASRSMGMQPGFLPVRIQKGLKVIPESACVQFLQQAPVWELQMRKNPQAHKDILMNCAWDLAQPHPLS